MLFVDALVPIKGAQQPLRKMKSNCNSSIAFSSNSSVLPLHVIGSGSIGLLYASKIQSAYKYRSKQIGLQPPVTLLMRKHHVPYLTTNINSNDENRQCKMLYAPVTMLSSSDTTTCEIRVEIIGQSYTSEISTLLLCTKANDACTALSSIWNRFSSSTTPRIIILSNGALAIRDAILKNFPAADVKIIDASTTHGVYRDSNVSDEYCIHHAGKGSTYSADRDFINICKESGLNGCELSQISMNIMLWKKLAVNCVANPLTAIHNVKNGELSGLQHNDQDIEFTITNILKEVSDVASKEIFTHFGNSNDALRVAQEELSVEALKKFVDQVLSDTASNISSMLQDVRAKRPTEIQFLNGHICRVAKEKYGIECPYNEAMCTTVEELLPDRS